MENNVNNVQKEIEQEEKLNNTKKTANVKTIILMILVLLLVLAVGIGAGLLLSGKIGKENVNNNNASSNQVQENKQEQINNNNDVSSNDQNAKDENSNQPVVPSNNSTNNTNKDNETNNKNDAYKVLGVDGNFYKLKDIALVQRTVNTQSENLINIDYDINKDGTKDNIKFEIKTDTSDGTPNKYINIIVNNEFYGEQIFYADELFGIYLVDCNTSDNYIDLITTKAQGSGWREYTLYKYNGKEYKENEKKSCYNEELYINQKGILTTKALYFVTSNPIITSEYYDYNTEKTIKLDVSKYSDTKIKFSNVYFSEDPEKEQDVFDVWEDKSFEEALKVNNVIAYDSVEVYLMEIVETKNGIKYKVKLLDGTVGYFLGPWAG